MIEPLSRALFHTLAASATVKRLASRYGMREGRFARRFIAGRTGSTTRSPLPARSPTAASAAP